jgi:hypothetical protein
MYDDFILLLTEGTNRQEYIRGKLDSDVFTNTNEYDGSRGADRRRGQPQVEQVDLDFINKLRFKFLQTTLKTLHLLLFLMTVKMLLDVMKEFINCISKESN